MPTKADKEDLEELRKKTEGKLIIEIIQVAITFLLC